MQICMTYTPPAYVRVGSPREEIHGCSCLAKRSLPFLLTLLCVSSLPPLWLSPKAYCNVYYAHIGDIGLSSPDMHDLYPPCISATSGYLALALTIHQMHQCELNPDSPLGL